MDQIHTILMQNLHYLAFYGGYSEIIHPASESLMVGNSYYDHHCHNLNNRIYDRTSSLLHHELDPLKNGLVAIRTSTNIPQIDNKK